MRSGVTPVTVKSGGVLAPGQERWRAGAHTGGVEPVGFGQPTLSAIPLGTSSGSHFHGQTRCREALKERPAGDVDHCGVLQRRLRLALDGGVAELLGGLRPLPRVARRTGQRQVAHPAGATARLGDDVFDLERDTRRATIGAPTLPLL